MNNLPNVTQLVAGRDQRRIMFMWLQACVSSFALCGWPTGYRWLWNQPSSWDPPQAFLSLRRMSLLCAVICRSFLPEHGPHPWQSPGTEGSPVFPSWQSLKRPESEPRRPSRRLNRSRRSALTASMLVLNLWPPTLMRSTRPCPATAVPR